jgi:hypothetical protein
LTASNVYGVARSGDGTLVFSSEPVDLGVEDGTVVWPASAALRIQAAPGRPMTAEIHLYWSVGSFQARPGHYRLEAALPDGLLRVDVRLDAWAPPGLDAAARQPLPATTLEVPRSGRARADVLADGTPVFVIADGDDRASVVSAISAHRPFGLGKLVAWCGPAGELIDLQHGSRFDEHGGYLFGPAPFGLVAYDTVPATRGVTVTGTRWPEPRSATGGTVGSGDCAGQEREFSLEKLVRHDASLWPSVRLSDVAELDDGWYRTSATLVYGGDSPPVLCGRLVSPESSGCGLDGVPAPSLQREDGEDDIAFRGDFLIRIQQRALADVVVFAELDDARTYTRTDARPRWTAGYLLSVKPRGSGDLHECPVEECPHGTLHLEGGQLLTLEGLPITEPLTTPPEDFAVQRLGGEVALPLAEDVAVLARGELGGSDEQRVVSLAELDDLDFHDRRVLVRLRSEGKQQRVVLIEELRRP